MKHSTKLRFISGMVGTVLLIISLYLRTPFIYLPALLIAVVGVYEFNQAFRSAGFKPMTTIALILASVVVLAYIFNSTFNYKIDVLLILISFMAILGYHVFTEHQIVDIMILVFSFVYVVMPILLILNITKRQDNFIWLIFVLAVSTDLFAYFVGKLFGRTKLSALSPKKTVEGALAGVVGCVLTTLLFCHFFIPQMPLQAAILVGLIGSIISQIGDLTASKIKRYCGIKDFGKIMPGHGGVLDRFDSILFTATLVFMYVWVFYH